MTEGRLVWTDIETSGLDPDECQMLEVGFRITDLELNTLAEKSVLIWNDTWVELLTEDKVNPLVWNMHIKSELWVDAALYGITLDVATEMLLDWFEENDVDNTEPLCGSSVQFDRGWLEAHMPEVISKFSYRNIDISSVKELCRRYNPVLYAKLDTEILPKKAHRVLSDLDDTISEFKFYRDNFLFWED